MNRTTKTGLVSDLQATDGGGWLLGTIASLLSVFCAYILATAISEWSGYVGHESATAMTILVVFGLITFSAWGATALTFVAARAAR